MEIVQYKMRDHSRLIVYELSFGRILNHICLIKQINKKDFYNESIEKHRYSFTAKLEAKVKNENNDCLPF
jgi:hypothetical protein